MVRGNSEGCETCHGIGLINTVKIGEWHYIGGWSCPDCVCPRCDNTGRVIQTDYSWGLDRQVDSDICHECKHVS
jgi:hypothetical protein